MVGGRKYYRDDATERLSFKHFENSNNTPAYPMILKGLVELVENKFAFDEFTVFHDTEALIVFDGSTPIGLMAFTYVAWRRVIHVNLTYIVPEFRLMGAYSRLWEQMIQHAKKVGAVRIEGGVSVINKAMIGAAIKSGRTHVANLYAYDVPPAGFISGEEMGKVIHG